MVGVKKGFKHSEESKKKNSLAHKKYWKNGGMSKETREKIRSTMKRLHAEGKTTIGGKKLSEHPNWKGGVSFKYHTERQILMSRSRYKTWRENIFIRDNFICQMCGKRGIRLEAHHIKSWKDYPKERFNPENGITLCKKCHLALHNKIRKGMKDDISKILEKIYGSK